MSLKFSYRHLYYFWVVAKEGGLSRAAARLGMAVQTVSAQVRELENALGCALLKPLGRGVALTEAGVEAMRRADLIFQLGEQLPEAVRDAASSPAIRLSLGVAEGLPKLIVQRLMQPIILEPTLRLVCYEDEFENLLGRLALHRLDVVLADRLAPPNPNLKLFSYPLGVSALAWYAPASWFEDAARDFPRSLGRVPLVLPTSHAAVRQRIDRWFEHMAIRPRIVGEFEDSALLKTFASSGLGVFPATELVHEELVARYGVHRVGLCDNVEEQFFAVVSDKKVMHPLVQRLLHDSQPERRAMAAESKP